MKYPSKGDWVNQVNGDLKDFGINLSMQQIKLKSKSSFKGLVKKKAKEFAFEYLSKLKDQHSKMNNLFYTKLGVQEYLKSKEISVKAAKNLFKWRTRSACFKSNYKNNYSNLLCPFGHNVEDPQEHSLSCFEERNGFKIIFQYTDLFKSNISSDVAQTLLKISKSREDVSL